MTARGQPFEQIAAASPEMLGMLMLKGDRHAERLDDRAQHAAVTDALADGAATATDLRTRFPGLSPRRIADELGIPVATTDDDPLVGTIWRFAEYRPRPPKILLYERGLAPLEQALARRPAARLLGEATVEDVFIAHELYHHLEATRAVTPIARRHQATLFQIGKWRWRTGIAALAEIAAGAFAQGLLGLPCHPKVLDFAASEGIGGRTANEFAFLTQALLRTENPELHSSQRASVEPEGEPSTEAAQTSTGRSQPVRIAESLNDLEDLHDLVLRESRANPDQGKQHLNADAGHDSTIRASGNGVDCAR